MLYLDTIFLELSNYDAGEGFSAGNDSMHPLVFMKVNRQDINMISIVSILMLCPLKYILI